MKTNNITFIGGHVAKRLTVSDPDSDKLSRLAALYGIHTTNDNHLAIASADVVVLAVKPQILKGVATDLAPAIQEKQPLVISIAAGVQESALHRWLGESVALVRGMPNPPAMLQAGATGLHAGKGVNKEQKSLAESILRAVGITCWVDEESLMDVVTAISGSGPAYFFLVMEAMEDAARDMGMDEDTARLLTLQTALGAARMAMESNDPPGILRSKVTSPGGTTEKALARFEQGNLRGLFRDALTAARDRSEELSKMLGDQKKLNNNAD